MESERSESESGFARAQNYARARLGLDFGRTLTRGGGGTLALVTVAFAGLYLPGLVRLALLVVAGIAVRLAYELPASPLVAYLRLAAAFVIGWLALAWGLGLLQPVVAVALLVLIGVEFRLWWQYREADSAPDVEEPAPPPREPTADERLDALLADAPLEGLPFADIVEAMSGHMARSTVALRLKERGWKVPGGRWRARPNGVDEP